MAKYRITGPDGGTYEVTAPDDATQEQVLAYAQQNYKPQTFSRRTAAAQTNNDPISTGARNFAQEMPWHQQALAGVGSFMNDMSLGAKQLVSPNSPELSAQAAENRVLDRGLKETGAGQAGRIGAALVPAVAASVIPGVNTYAGSAALGAGLGLLEPTENGISGKLTNAAMGGGAGMVGQGMSNVIGRVMQPVQSSLNPEQSRLAQLALKEGIPLDAAAQTGSKPLLTMNSVMANLPFTAGAEAEKQNATKEAFNSAVLKRAGINATSATPDVLSAQKRALGKTFEDVASRNSIGMNPQLLNDLAAIRNEAERRMAKPGPLTNTVDDILSDFASGAMPGQKYQGWRGLLRTMSGNDVDGMLAAKLKKTLDDAFTAQVSGADGQAWNQASRQYANWKTIAQAMGGAGNEAASGNVAPAQIASALTNAMSKEGNALGRGDLNDLARIGKLFVRDNIPDSATAQRQLWQSLLTGNAATGALAAGASLPVTAAAAGASLAMPKVIQSLMNTKPMQNYLATGVQNETTKALAKALQAGAVPAALVAPAAYSDQ